MRTLYREARVILGFKPPPETETQVAERLCGELKSEIGGKKQQHGEDYFLEAKFQDREVKILFEATLRRAVVQVGSTLEGGPPFVLVSGQSAAEVPPGEERKAVASGLFAQGDGSDVTVMIDLWKALPTGARGNLTTLVNKHKAELRFEDGSVRLTPETPTLDGPSAKYNIKSLLQTLVTLTTEMETAWSNL